MLGHHPLQILLGLRGRLLGLRADRRDVAARHQPPRVVLRVLELHPRLPLCQHDVVSIGPHLHCEHPADRQIVAGLPPLLGHLLAVGKPHRENAVQPVDLRLEHRRLLLGLAEQQRERAVVLPRKLHSRVVHRRHLGTPGRIHEGLHGPIAREQLVDLGRRLVVGPIRPHHFRIKKVSEARRHVGDLAVTHTAAGLAIGVHAEIDTACLGTELRQAERTEAGIDRLIPIAARPNPHHLRIERLGPLLHHGPLDVVGIFRIELLELDPHVTHPKRRWNPDHVDPHRLRAAVGCNLIGVLLVVANLVGERDDHHVSLGR